MIVSEELYENLDLIIEAYSKVVLGKDNIPFITINLVNFAKIIDLEELVKHKDEIIKAIPDEYKKESVELLNIIIENYKIIENLYKAYNGEIEEINKLAVKYLLSLVNLEDFNQKEAFLTLSRYIPVEVFYEDYYDGIKVDKLGLTINPTKDETTRISYVYSYVVDVLKEVISRNAKIDIDNMSIELFGRKLKLKSPRKFFRLLHILS